MTARKKKVKPVFSRRCPQCNRTFKTSDPRRRYCDDSCRVLHHYYREKGEKPADKVKRLIKRQLKTVTDEETLTYILKVLRGEVEWSEQNESAPSAEGTSPNTNNESEQLLKVRPVQLPTVTGVTGSSDQSISSEENS